LYDALRGWLLLLWQAYGLGENPSIVTAKAEVAYYQQDSQTAYQLAKKVYECDPYNYRCV
jgi:cytochrome c-type biogenesis protein CcmH/NrfG